ncbi:MAG: HlyD family efflux transporter periplasmic adaptor subunit [Planctomycetota bacterium]
MPPRVKRLRSPDRNARRRPASRISSQRSLAALFAFGAVLGVTGCGRDEATGASAPPKPVSVATLRFGVPRTETLVAGVVEPFRRSDVSFDVSGIVAEVTDVGEAAAGPQLDGTGKLLLNGEGAPVREGTVLAVLDPVRFQQAVAAAELAMASSDRQIEAIEVELSTVFPARVESARATLAAAAADVDSARQSVAAADAELELARTTVERDRVLIGSGAIAKSVLDQSESVFRTASAGVAQANAALNAATQNEQAAIASLAETEGSFRVRQADLESPRASRAELVNTLEQAQTDLRASVLRAPFRGRVTARYTERGAFQAAGSPIVELTMETAVKVVITVSAEEERGVALGMRMPIYLSDTRLGEDSLPLIGTVFEKASVADRGTRTFRIGLILPNPLQESAGVADATDGSSLRDFFPVIRFPGTPEDHLYVNVACVLERDGRSFVLVLPDDIGTASATGAVQVPRVVPIRLTDDWEQLDTETLRRIEPQADVRASETLIRDPDDSDREGVVVARRQFVLRAGDVVRVGLAASLPPPGFWVPATAIVPRSGDSLVYIARSGAAQEISVSVAESSGRLRRVEAPELREGDDVVVRGMQYLSDGDAITSQRAPSGVAQ